MSVPSPPSLPVLLASLSAAAATPGYRAALARLACLAQRRAAQR